MQASHWVFAYGSNMHVEDLERWFREHARPAPVILEAVAATLRGHRLVFNYYSEARQGGAANITSARDEHLPGVALSVDDATFDAIALKEGYPKIYQRELLEVELRGEQRINAWVYKVAPAQCSTSVVPPTRHYRSLLIDGARAHGLAETHVAWLMRLLTCD